MKIGTIVSRPSNAQKAKLYREKAYAKQWAEYEAKAKKTVMQAKLEQLGFKASTNR